MSAADKEPPGCPDYALCTAVTIPLRISLAVFFNAKVSIILSFLTISFAAKFVSCIKKPLHPMLAFML